jgi:hypothetical protein
MWILEDMNRILYNVFNVNANFNMKGANGYEKYSKNKMEVLVLC